MLSFGSRRGRSSRFSRADAAADVAERAQPLLDIGVDRLRRLAASTCASSAACARARARARRRAWFDAARLVRSPGSACEVVQLAARRRDELVASVAHGRQLAPAVVEARIPALRQRQQVQPLARAAGIRRRPAPRRNRRCRPGRARSASRRRCGPDRRRRAGDAGAGDEQRHLHDRVVDEEPVRLLRCSPSCSPWSPMTTTCCPDGRLPRRARRAAGRPARRCRPPRRRRRRRASPESATRTRARA